MQPTPATRSPLRQAFAFVAMLALALQSVHVVGDDELHVRTQPGPPPAGHTIGHPGQAMGHPGHADEALPQLPEKTAHVCPCCILCGKLGSSLAPVPVVLAVLAPSNAAAAQVVSIEDDPRPGAFRAMLPVGARAPPAFRLIAPV